MSFTTLAIPHFVQIALQIIEEAGYEAWLVGGCVRDMLLGRNPHDWDICTDAHPDQIGSLFAQSIPTGLQHGTVTVISDGSPIEVTTWRAETTYSDHRRPDCVTYTKSLTEDLSRRDFTINAMAWHLERGLADPFDGRLDLQRKLVRCVGNPQLRFEEDALRMLRALRFCSELDFTLDAATAEAITCHAACLQYISKERILQELRRMLTGKEPTWLHQLWATGLAHAIFPLPAPDIRLYAVLKELRVCHADEVLYWAALLFVCQFSVEALKNMRLEKSLLCAIQETLHYMPYMQTATDRNLRFCLTFSSQHARRVFQLASLLNQHGLFAQTNGGTKFPQASLPQASLPLPYRTVTGKQLADMGFVGKEISDMQLLLRLIWCEQPQLFLETAHPDWLIQALSKKTSGLPSR